MTIYAAVSADRIKVGFTSRSVQRRLRDIEQNLAAPLSLLHEIEGDRNKEMAIHERLASYRLKGEWFQDTPDVRSILEDIAANGITVRVREKPKSPSLPQNRQPYGTMLRKLSDLIWPGEAVQGLSVFAEVDEDTVRDWFADKSSPSDLIRYAFSARLLRWMGQPSS